MDTSFPVDSNRGILKIDTNTDTVTELDVQRYQGWRSCAAALDGCIYFMPYHARRIMKLDPKNNDAISSVGDDLGEGLYKYIGTVVGIDGCMYGISQQSYRIVKYDPINDITSFVGDEVDQFFDCNGDGALGRDGCIYASRRGGRVLKINTHNNFHCVVGNKLNPCHYYNSDAILGCDGCIYWPPLDGHFIRKYDPDTDRLSFFGNDFGSHGLKWYGGCLASDGVIYCMPHRENRILSINPWKEYTHSMKNSIVEHSRQLGLLFHPSNDIPDVTNFDRAVTKFGHKKVLEAFADCMAPLHRLCAVFNLYPFMIAASYESSDISVIYILLRQVPSSLVNCTHHVIRDIY